MLLETVRHMLLESEIIIREAFDARCGCAALYVWRAVGKLTLVECAYCGATWEWAKP